MAEPRPDWIRADICIDLQGETCPIPELTVAKKLKNVSPGTVLEVLTDHQPAADVTLPALAKGKGYGFYAERSGNLYRVYIAKR